MIDFDTEARQICADRDQWFQDLKTYNRTPGVTAADVDALMARSEQIDQRVEQLRRRFYPRAHRLVISHGSAVTVSPTGRSTRRVWTA